MWNEELIHFIDGGCLVSLPPTRFSITTMSHISGAVHTELHSQDRISSLSFSVTRACSVHNLFRVKIGEPFSKLRTFVVVKDVMCTLNLERVCPLQFCLREYGRDG